MRTNTKKSIVSLGIAGILLAPVQTLAAGPLDAIRNTLRGKTDPEVSANVCMRITAYSSELVTRVTDRATSLDSTFKQNKALLEADTAALNKALKESRGEYDKNRTEQIAKLAARATTTAQIDAVLAFKNAVDKAVAARRNSVDGAVKIFREGLNTVLDARAAAISQSAAEFKAAVDLASAKAKKDCASGVDSKAVRANFNTDLQTAQETFASHRKAIDQIDVKVRSLINARQVALDTAYADFAAAVQKAGEDLKKALQ